MAVGEPAVNLPGCNSTLKIGKPIQEESRSLPFATSFRALALTGVILFYMGNGTLKIAIHLYSLIPQKMENSMTINDPSLRIQIPTLELDWGFQSHPKRIGMDRCNPEILGHTWMQCLAPKKRGASWKSASSGDKRTGELLPELRSSRVYKEWYG